MSYEKVKLEYNIQAPETSILREYTPNSEAVTSTLGRLALQYALTHSGGNFMAPTTGLTPTSSVEDPKVLEALLAAVELANKPKRGL